MGNLKNKIGETVGSDKFSASVLTAIIIAVIMVANVFLYVVVELTDFRYHENDALKVTLSGATDDLFASAIKEGKKVKISFCLSEKDIETHGTGSFVYETAKLFAERYPGDGIVDMLGFDCYQYSTDEVYMADMKNALDVMAAFNQSRGKLMAVTETGYEGIPNPQWWTKVLYESVKDYPIAYVLTWRNACDAHMQHHYYAPFSGQVSADDFKAFASQKDIVMASF